MTEQEKQQLNAHIEKLAKEEDPLQLLQAVRHRFEIGGVIGRSVDTLPFVQAAIDVFIGYGRRRHTLKSTTPRRRQAK